MILIVCDGNLERLTCSSMVIMKASISDDYNKSYRVVSRQILVKVIKFCMTNIEKPINGLGQCGHFAYSTAPLFPRPRNNKFFLLIHIKLSTSSQKV